jgi:S-methyl-5-thioribose-1-phosphate isomerase
MKKFLFVIFLISLGVILQAQDVHFSQIYEAPLAINPSFTGYFDGNHRIAGNYKSQWNNIQKGFSTFDLSYEYSFYNPAKQSGFLGLGVFFYNDVAGPMKLSTQNYTLNVAYHVRVGEGNYIGAGIYGGYVQKAFDDQELQWGSQYDENYPGFNPTLPSGETFEKTSFGVPDFGFGLQWNMIKGAKTMSSNDGYRVNLGVGLFHLNQPKYQFYTGSEEQLKMRIAIHAQGQIGIEFVNNEINACYKIGTYGVELIKAIHNQSSNIVNILTHCNAGWLACGDYGTALAPIFEANKQNIPIHVWVDETRPLNQGSRLTAWELYNEKIPFSVITDNTGGLLMMKHNVDMIIIGADRIARNGDVANKIGSYLKALAAVAHSIPFYVAAPISTFDFSLDSGDDIPIEQRHSSEIQSIQSFYNDEWISSELFPSDYQSINYAFDITPAKFINSFITEKGIYKNINDLIKQGKYNKNRQS